MPGKILERMVHSQIVSHLDFMKILLPEQGGYRKSCSTLDTISKLTNNILRNRNVGKFTLAAFIDIKKAFDSVNYIILISKFKKAGIFGKNLDWITNYFVDRTQITKANNTLSGTAKLTCGVPQGSILGPLFFLIYINDVKIRDVKVKTLLYADDTVLYVAGNNLISLSNSLQSAMDDFVSWSSKNKLTLNESKTKLMLFASKRRAKNINIANVIINANGKRLSFVNTFKYLGVNLDCELNMNHHVKELKKALAFKSYLLARLKSFIPSDILLKIYKVYALPLFDYADVYYGGAGTEQLLELQRIQNRCLKYCLKLPKLTATDYVHQEASMPTLEKRRLYHTQLYGFKRSKLNSFIDVRPLPTRAADAPLLMYHLIHTASYERSIEVNVSQTWNKLPPIVRQTETLSEFKSLMKESLKDSIPTGCRP